jgi:hypothetical protein
MPYLPDRHTDPQDIAPSFPGMSMRDFMQHTSIYEHKPAPFSPLLRRATWTGIVLTTLVAATILLLPNFATNLHTLFFPLIPQGFNGFLSSYVHWLTHNRWIAFLDGALLVAGGILLILTCNLRQGNIAQHWLAFIEALGGISNLLLILIPLAMLLANIIVWALALIIALVLFVILIRILAEFLR